MSKVLEYHCRPFKVKLTCILYLVTSFKKMVDNARKKA